MKLRRLFPAIALLASACTLTPGQNVLDGQFTPPLVTKSWEVQRGIVQNGVPGCALTSGYNGLTVTVSRRPVNGEDVSVKSNRRMTPGATLTVNANSGSYQAYDTYFPPQVAHAMVQQFIKGGTAYLEWSEFSGPGVAERAHVQNIVPLDTFAAQLKACRDSLHE